MKAFIIVHIVAKPVMIHCVLTLLFQDSSAGVKTHFAASTATRTSTSVPLITSLTAELS